MVLVYIWKTVFVSRQYLWLLLPVRVMMLQLLLAFCFYPWIQWRGKKVFLNCHDSSASFSLKVGLISCGLWLMGSIWQNQRRTGIHNYGMLMLRLLILRWSSNLQLLCCSLSQHVFFLSSPDAVQEITIIFLNCEQELFPLGSQANCHSSSCVESDWRLSITGIFGSLWQFV